VSAETVSSYPVTAWREPFGVAETPAEYVFHRPRLYLETTIPSYLTARTSRDLTTARLQRITARWWNSWRTQFDIYVSDTVLKEASAGDPEAAQRRVTVLESFPTLESNDDSRALSLRIIERTKLPVRASVDAEHVALAAMHGMDILLTWNCAHLVNPQVAPTIEMVCRSEGYVCPTLCTPQQLMEKYEHARATG
jgi:hypothetical protein